MKRINSTERQKSPTPEMELSLLDLYCGCGGMSTGLCFGSRGGGVNLIAVNTNIVDVLWLSIVIIAFFNYFLIINRDGLLMETKLHVKASD